MPKERITRFGPGLNIVAGTPYFYKNVWCKVVEVDDNEENREKVEEELIPIETIGEKFLWVKLTELI
ncbi:MAG: hypothetical protein WAV11_01915 [Minisyncoccia bacterium]